MANASTTGFGFYPVMNLGNTPATSGDSKYKIASGLGIAICQNDPVSLQNSSGDQGYIQDASPATCDDGSTGGASYDVDASPVASPQLVGVFNGAFYIANTTNKPTWANTVAASTTFAANPNTDANSNDGFAFVNDNPFQEYMVKADAAVTIAYTGQRMNPNNNTLASAKSGQSVATLDIQGTDNDGRQWRILRSAEDPENNDVSAVGCNVIVVANAKANLFLASNK
jgi:hypothetical protein